MRSLVLSQSDFTRDVNMYSEGLTESVLQATLWSHVEVFLAILASSLVALRPLFRYVSGIVSSFKGSHSKENEQEELREMSIGVPPMHSGITNIGCGRSTDLGSTNSKERILGNRPMQTSGWNV
jgi:hypothetical protein